jgi:hypothetical protein
MGRGLLAPNPVEAPMDRRCGSLAPDPAEAP